MRKILITGIAGFVGSHLAESLNGKADLWGLHLSNDLSNIEAIKGINLIKCDLLDYTQVRSAIEQIRPDGVFHLAAQSAPSASFTHPAETLRVNIFASLNLFEAIVDISPNTVVINAGSGEVYGDVDAKDLPVREESELKPLNPYAVSKVTQDLLAFQYWRSKNLKVIRCRPFNHYGPRQADRFVTAEFAKQIAEIETGVRKDKILKVGNLEASKDFLYVKDVVSAYELLFDKGEHGSVYNICSGRAVKVQEIMDILISLSSERIEVIQDPSRMRPSDVKVLYGDAARLKSLGWSPRHSLKQGLKELLNFWREKVRKSDE